MATFPLRKGSKGPEVLKLQQFLNFRLKALNKALLQEDGIFGDKTQAALYMITKQNYVTETDYKVMLGALQNTANTSQEITNGTAPNVELMMNQLATWDQKTYLNLLKGIRILKKVRASGKPATKLEREAQAIAASLAGRQMKVRRSRYFNVKTGTPENYLPEAKQLNDLLGVGSMAGIGVAPLVIAGIVLAVIIVSAATVAIYQNFVEDHKRSSVDLKKSDLFLKACENLTPEEKEQLEDDLQQQIDDSYDKGYDGGKKDKNSSMIMTLGLVALGAWGFSQITKGGGRRGK